jgi:DNA-binding MarR family transcriptional regulator
VKYKDFSDEFLVAAYHESRLHPGETLRSGDIVDRYPLVFEPGWVVQLVRDLGVRGYFTSKGVDADDRGQPIRLTGRGLRVAEDLIEKGIGIFRLDLGDGIGFPGADDTADATATVSSPQLRLGQDHHYLIGLLLAECDDHIGTVYDLKQLETDSFSKRQVREAAVNLHEAGLATLSKVAVPGQRRSGDMLMLTPLGIVYALRNEAQVLKAMMSGGSISDLQRVREAFDRLQVGQNPVEPQEEVPAVAPASDRLVRIDHNQPGYQEILTGLSEVRDAVRGANDLGEEERDRLVASLGAAESLWQAGQLKMIQIKIGVVMAVQDAAAALGATAKAVAAALLVDTIKGFIKSHTGIDLDNM